jgi:hypothetical protein
MRIRPACLIAAIAALAGCDPVTVPMRGLAEVYDFRLPVGSDSLVMHWPNGTRIRVYVNPAPEMDRTQLLVDGLSRGAAAWEGASLFGDYSFQEVGNPQGADVVLTWSDVALPINTAQCPPGGGAAYTTFCLTPERDALEPFPLINDEPNSRVRFLVTVRADATLTAARVQSLVAHELGHVLGLARHSPNSADLMFNDPVARTEPNVRDRATVQLLYQLRPDIIP